MASSLLVVVGRPQRVKAREEHDHGELVSVAFQKWYEGLGREGAGKVLPVEAAIKTDMGGLRQPPYKRNATPFEEVWNGTMRGDLLMCDGGAWQPRSFNCTPAQCGVFPELAFGYVNVTRSNVTDGGERGRASAAGGARDARTRD